jgi:hypothetical protein
MLNVPTVCAPVIGVVPVDHDFGDVPVGNRVATRIIITNFDGCHLHVSDIRFGGSTDPCFHFLALPAFPLLVPSETSTEVEVEFCPTCGSCASGFVEVASDDPIRPVLRVALHGVGTGSGAASPATSAH